MDGSLVFASWRQCAPYLIHASSGQRKSTIKTLISIGSAVYTTSQQRTAILHNQPPFSPYNCPFLCGYLDPHLIHGSMGPPESSTQTASASRSV